MTVCDICGKPASRSFTLTIDNGITRTAYYCKDHNPRSKPQGITFEQMKKMDPEFTKKYG